MHLQSQLLSPLLLLLLQAARSGSQTAIKDEQVGLSEEPFLRELFSGDEAPQLHKLTSCLDSVFNLNRAYEVLFSLKSIYNDYLSNKTDKLTDFEQRLLLFCRDALPSGGVAGYFRHPVNAHKFVTFAARVMNPKLHGLITENSGVKVLLTHLVANAGCWLNEASVTESIENLLAVKGFYGISVGDFARGNFANRYPESGFTVQELMEILLHLNRQSDPVLIVEMAEYLRRERIEEVRSLGEQPVRSVYRILGKAYYQTKQFDKAVDALLEYKRSAAAADVSRVDADLDYIAANRRGGPEDFEEDAASAARRSVSGLELEFGLTAEALGSAKEAAAARENFRRYRRLCGGGGDDGAVAAGSTNISSNPLLICEVWRPGNGWYPIRKEILTVSPLVVRYLDALPGRNLTDALMREAERRLFEAPPDLDPISAADRVNRLTKVRVHSFSQPIMPFDSNATRSIIRRVEFVTGMDASVHFASSEKYIEVANHGHGIRNKPHVTAKLPNLFYNSMATALFFPVEDVVGGELVFTDRHLRIPVKRSDLVVWYNYLPTYHIDWRAAIHADCPILFGEKWTAQIPLGLTRCSLDQEVTMDAWLPGTTMARRRSVAKSWTALVRPKRPTEVTNVTAGGNDTASSATSSPSNSGDGANFTASVSSDAATEKADLKESDDDAKKLPLEEENVESTDANEKDEFEEE